LLRFLTVTAHHCNDGLRHGATAQGKAVSECVSLMATFEASLVVNQPHMEVTPPAGGVTHLLHNSRDLTTSFRFINPVRIDHSLVYAQPCSVHRLCDLDMDGQDRSPERFEI
jgi:hypothetical protein